MKEPLHIHEINTEERKQNKPATIIAAISVVVALVSVIVYLYCSLADGRETAKLHNLDRHYTMLNTLFKQQNEMYKEIKRPIVNIRDRMEKIYTLCNSHNPLNGQNREKIKGYISEIDNYKVALVIAYGASPTIFNNTVFYKIQNFVKEVEDIQYLVNPCDLTLLKPSRWRSMNNEIDINMLNEVNKTGSEMNKIIKAYQFR